MKTQEGYSTLDNKTDNKYDEVPYKSWSFSSSHPRKLQAIGKLFGLNSPDIKNARILELGCASGGNIIPIANYFPNTKIVGIDLSNTQISAGQKIINDLKLNNIELLKLSIEDIDESFGKFDYIISHGVFSWVPENIQNKMLEICANNLSEDGLVYISYNTLPGWNFSQIIRDMMLYHTSKLNKPEDKLAQSRAILQFVNEAHQGIPTGEQRYSQYYFYSKIISEEIALLSKADDSYLYHDHLEDNNHPIYFYQFMERAMKNKLQYVGDSSLRNMYLGTLPQVAIDKLKNINNAIIQEQYMDFIVNRKFRATILCKQNQVINRNVDKERMNNLFYKSDLKHNFDFNIEKIMSAEPLTFTYKGSMTLTESNFGVKLLLYILSVNNSFTSFQAIRKEAKQLIPKLNVASFSDEAAFILLDLVFKDIVDIAATNDIGLTSISAKPKVSPYLNYLLANKNSHLVNFNNDIIKVVSSLEIYLISLIDGTNTSENLKNHLLNYIKKNRISLTYKGVNYNENNIPEEVCGLIIKENLEFLLRKQLLIA